MANETLKAHQRLDSSPLGGRTMVGPRMRIIPFALLAVLFAIGLGTSTDNADAVTVIDGDMVVDHDLVWADDTFQVNGNVTVLGGNHLTLLRATVDVNGTANGTHWFNVSTGGILTAVNSTIRGSPHPIGITLAGNAHLVDSFVETVWSSNSTPAILVSGPSFWEGTTVRYCPSYIGILVTGALDAEDCTITDLGDVALVFEDPTVSQRSYIRNTTFGDNPASALDTVGLDVRWSSSIIETVSLDIVDCTFEDLTYGLTATLNTINATLNVTSTRTAGCDNGVSVVGNNATVNIIDCHFDIAITTGLYIYVVDPQERILDLTVWNITVTGSGNGISIWGPALGFVPVLSNVDISGCNRGIAVQGSTVLVEDSRVLECTTCFFVATTARIEVRTTEHTHRSAEIQPGDRAAIVAYSTLTISSARWQGAHAIDNGFLYLFGEDGIELERVDMADPQPVEVVIWSLTKFNDLGRWWVVPSYDKDGHEFTGLNFSIYNTSAQDLEIIDHLPPDIFDVWPEDGQWYVYDAVDASGRVEDNGSGLESLIVRIVDGQERVVDVQGDGNWSVTFDPQTDGPLTIEVEATDLTGGSTSMRVANLTIDTELPDILIEHGFIDLGNGTYLVPANDVILEGWTEPFSTVNARDSYSVQGSPYNNNVTVEADDEGHFSVGLGLGPGYHDIVVTSTDIAGNVGVTTMSLAMDAAGPDIEVQDPRPDEHRWFNTSSVKINGRALDPGLSDWFRLWVGDHEVEGPGGDFTVAIDLSDGSHSILVRAVDQAGHSTNVTVHVRVDATPPELVIVSPGEDVFFTEEIKVDLQGEVQEVNLDTLTMNGLPLAALQGVFTSVLTIHEGDNVFDIVATDLAGNRAERRLVITKDLLPPEYILTVSMEDGDLLDIDGNNYATFIGDGTPHLTLTFNVSEHSIVTASGGLGQVEGEGSLQLSIDLDEGPNSITFSIEDLSGNAGTPLNYRVFLDTTPPEIVLQGADGEVRTKDATQWVRGRVEVGSVLTLDGESVKVNADGTFSTEVELAKGENTFHLEATDLVGLVSTQDVVIIREAKDEESPGPTGPVVLLALAVVSFALASASRRRS
jgi:hypothetical protein